MGDRLGNLDGKAKVLGHSGCPALVGRYPMRAVERGVDLNGVEHCAIPLEVRSRWWERGGIRLGNAPPCSADPHGQAPSSRWLEIEAVPVKSALAASRRHSS